MPPACVRIRTGAERRPLVGHDEILDRVALGRLVAVVGSCAGVRLRRT
jgi:hypothetical protein